MTRYAIVTATHWKLQYWDGHWSRLKHFVNEEPPLLSHPFTLLHYPTEILEFIDQDGKMQVQVTQLCPSLCDPMNYTVLPLLWGETCITCIRWKLVAVRGGNIGESGLHWLPRWLRNACNAGDMGSVPGSGRLSWAGNGYPLQYSYLEKPMDRGAW